MKLTTLIKAIAPIDSVEKLNELMNILKLRNTCISNDVNTKILNITITTMYEFVVKEIQKYKSNYKIKPNPSAKTKSSQSNSKPRKKTKSRTTIGLQGLSSNDPINLHRNLERMNNRSSSNSLRSQGYDYGLSDW